MCMKMSSIFSFYLLYITCMLSVTSNKFDSSTNILKKLEDDFMKSYDLMDNVTWPVNHTIMKPCAAFLNAYAKYTSNFTKCLIENARPFRLCETCVEPYTKASTIFHDLNDKSNPCFNRLLSADRVQVIRIVSNDMQTMWTAADCKYCFSSVIENSTSGELNITLNNSTEEFLKLFQRLTVCLNRTIEDPDLMESKNTSVVCKKCRAQYRALNKHFESIQDETSNHACMDVMDMMNYTRLIWSKRYNCTHRKGDMAPVLVLATIVCLLPVLFYVGHRLYGGRYHHKQIIRQKRMHRPVDSSYGSTGYLRSTDSRNSLISS